MNAYRIRITALALLNVLAMGVSLNQSVFANDAGDQARFSRVFSDHMVMQRDQAIQIWGQAQARAELTVSLAGESKTTRADADGNWQVDLAAMPAGGPYTLRLKGSHGEEQSFSDVLIGDVWLCAGQSNMEFPAGEVNQRGAEPPRTPGTIRLMTIPKDSQVLPLSDYAKSPGWQLATTESIHDFSAVCYLLAYELQKTHDIPFGLINASWGGSAIKPWISAGELKRTGSYDKELEWLQTYASDSQKANRQFGQAWEDWWNQSDAASTQPWDAPANDLSGWTASPAVMGNWKLFGDPSLADHHGMVWFRKSFDLNTAQAEQGAVLALGGIDEVDYLWINGHFIGTTFGYGTERFYDVPRGTLQAGTNTITVNVLNTWAAGGMVGPNERVSLKFANEQSLALGHGWYYRKVPARVGMPLRAPWESLGGLTGLSNAMIAPLQGLNLAGAIWYQGETDAGNPGPYEQLLTALTADWREMFSASLPFLIVQLPNFGELPLAPGESGWAAIRDAQRRVADAHDSTGLVVTLDLGDREDLHPPDKRAIGRRAADVARVIAYGQQGIADGLAPTAAFWRGSDVVLEFDADIDGLVVIGAAAPIAFELCGESPGDCVYADSRLEGNDILLKAHGRKNVSRVRHCWADAPVCNLYGASGLPVSSFEIQIPPGHP